MLVPVVALLLQRPWHDRTTFNAAMARVEEGMSPAKVRAILGSPDDVWTPMDSSLYADAESEVWCYGTNGHLAFPTLGRVVFQREKAAWIVGDFRESPVPNLPSEKDLVRALRAIDRPRSHDYGYDPLHVIRAVNALLPLGKTQALAVMIEYERLTPSFAFENWLYPVSFTLFESKRPFPTPAIGAIYPSPPKDPATWPTFPIIVVRDVPFSFFGGVMLAGFPEPFEMYAGRASKDWTIRKLPLTPPDDPFPAFVEALDCYRSKPGNSGATNVGIDRDLHPFASLLRMLREVYPTDRTLYEDADADRVEAHHRAFLKLGVRWSRARQRYVRSDDTWTESVEPRFPVQFERLKTPAQLSLTVVVERATPAEVQYRIELETKPRPVTFSFRIVDTDTGRDIAAHREPKKVASSMAESSGWLSQDAQHIRFEVTISGKTYLSRVFKTLESCSRFRCPGDRTPGPWPVHQPHPQGSHKPT
jgi:hypothetical protein